MESPWSQQQGRDPGLSSGGHDCPTQVCETELSEGCSQVGKEHLWVARVVTDTQGPDSLAVDTWVGN